MCLQMPSWCVPLPGTERSTPAPTVPATHPRVTARLYFAAGGPRPREPPWPRRSPRPSSPAALSITLSDSDCGPRGCLFIRCLPKRQKKRPHPAADKVGYAQHCALQPTCALMFTELLEYRQAASHVGLFRTVRSRGDGTVPVGLGLSPFEHWTSRVPGDRSVSGHPGKAPLQIQNSSPGLVLRTSSPRGSEEATWRRNGRGGPRAAFRAVASDREAGPTLVPGELP